MSTLHVAYDAHTYEGGWPHTAAWLNAWLPWLRLHGVEPNDTYRVEFHVIDAPLIRIYQHALNEDGHPYVDPATGRVAQRPPFDVLITSPAPRPEDYR
jgi:hypothetical protein